MSYKYTDIVRIKEGFYKGHIGAVTAKLGHRINGNVGEPSETVYEVLLLSGKHLVEVGEKDLKPETLPEIKEEQKETEEATENAIENKEEEKDALLETQQEKDTRR